MKRISTLLFAAAVLSTMGFGVASATAQPRMKTAEAVCPFARSDDVCRECCAGVNLQGYFTGTECNCY